jgi:hypothetical protein
MWRAEATSQRRLNLRFRNQPDCPERKFVRYLSDEASQYSEKEILIVVIQLEFMPKP